MYAQFIFKNKTIATYVSSGPTAKHSELPKSSLTCEPLYALNELSDACHPHGDVSASLKENNNPNNYKLYKMN